MGPGQTPQDVAGDLSVYFGRKRVAKMNQSGSLVALRRAFFVGLTFSAGLPALRGDTGLSGAASIGCALPASGWMADQTRATAFLRS